MRLEVEVDTGECHCPEQQHCQLSKGQPRGPAQGAQGWARAAQGEAWHSGIVWHGVGLFHRAQILQQGAIAIILAGIIPDTLDVGKYARNLRNFPLI